MGRLRSNIWLFASGNQSISFEFAIKEWSCLPFCLLASVYLPLRCSCVKKVCQKCRPLSQLRNSIKMSRISNRTVIQWKLLNWISLQLRMQPNVMAIGGVRAKAQTHGIQDVVNVIRVDRRKIRLIIHSSSAIFVVPTSLTSVLFCRDVVRCIEIESSGGRIKLNWSCTTKWFAQLIGWIPIHPITIDERPDLLYDQKL